MKQSENGGFCVLYVEPGDDKTAVLQAINGQKKPVVMLLAEQSRTFQRPDDFTTLKHLKRQLDVPIVFVIPQGGHLVQLAGRNGFPVYPSMDALAEALATGQPLRARSLARPAAPSQEPSFAPRKTVPLPETIAAMPVVPKRIRELDDALPFYSDQEVPFEEASFPARTISGPLVGTFTATNQVKKTEPLSSPSGEFTRRRTAPLSPSLSSGAAPSLQPPVQPQQENLLVKALAILAIFALAIAGLGSFLLFYQKMPEMTTTAAAPVVTVGRVSFLSSGQLSNNSNQGIDDEVLIDLHNIPDPAPQKSYYGWLLSDKKQSDERAILLGALRVNKGTVHLLYPGDAAHTNLLAITSRFLVTEEDAAVTPISPTPDFNAWHFYGEISQTPINAPDNVQHFSYLDHLRHLLAADPTLDQMELPGGLNTWLYRNTSEVLGWMTSMREPWEDNKDIGFVRRQTIRALTYLDGVSYVQQDVPPNTNLLVDERLARIGLLEVKGPTQDPPAYLTHIVQHLNGLLQGPGATPELRKTIADIVMALNNATYWLTQLRLAAQKVMKMSDAQLQQLSTLNLINDMIDDATNAYSGQIDPATGEMHEGVSWIHDHMQLIALFNISTFTANSQSIQMIQDTNHANT